MDKDQIPGVIDWIETEIEKEKNLKLPLENERLETLEQVRAVIENAIG